MSNKKQKKKTKLTILLITLLFLVILSVLLLLSIISKPTISYNINNFNEDYANISVDIKDKSLIRRNYEIAIDNNLNVDENTIWQTHDRNNTYDLKSDTYYIHTRDSLNNVVSTDSIINSTLYIDIKDNLKYPFYPINEDIDIDYKVLTIGKDENFIIQSSDESIISIKDNKIHTNGVGNCTITISSNNISDSIDIEVTDLYTSIDTDSMSKPILNKTICDITQAHKLDEVLRIMIEDAGYQTRAGAVAAARFLTLQFPYRLAYFAESGKLDSTNDPRLSDGEGRYYHKGLYLSEDKFDDLVASIYGKKYWGQYFMEDTTEDHSRDAEFLEGGLTTADLGSSLYKMKRPNGLDCGGFVSWCYYNAGFDFGDMGAGGPGTYGMSMLGERVSISDELLKSDRIKAGDLCGFIGHVGIVVGVEDDYIWIADTIRSGTKVRRYERNIESFNALGADAFTYFMLMDDEYKQDGNYTPMW